MLNLRVKVSNSIIDFFNRIIFIARVLSSNFSAVNNSNITINKKVEISTKKEIKKEKIKKVKNGVAKEKIYWYNRDVDEKEKNKGGKNENG